MPEGETSPILELRRPPHRLAIDRLPASARGVDRDELTADLEDEEVDAGDLRAGQDVRAHAPIIASEEDSLVEGFLTDLEYLVSAVASHLQAADDPVAGRLYLSMLAPADSE